MSFRRISLSLAAVCPRVHAEKVCKIMDMATKEGAPVIGLNDLVARAFRKALSRWVAMLIFSCGILWLPALCRRFQRSWGHVLAVQSIHLR